MEKRRGRVWGALSMAGNSARRPPTCPPRLDPEMRNGRGWDGTSPSPSQGLCARGRPCQLLATDLGTEVPAYLLAPTLSLGFNRLLDG